MPHALESVVDRVASSMSVSSLRHQVAVHNIAHRDSQGVQRLRLEFGRAFDAAPPFEKPSALRDLRAAVVIDRSETPVSVEQDMVELSENSMRYQALAKALGRYFSILSTIANHGRG